MGKSKGLRNPPESDGELGGDPREPRAEVRWSPRIAAAQHRLRWEGPSSPREHTITDLRLIQQIRRANGLTKRAIDVTLAAAGLIFLLPVLVVVAAVIAAVDRQNPIFGHKRVGRHGDDFRCWKFSSMRADGDAILAEHFAANPEAACEWSENRKLREDPRVTKLGRFLRKTSIDELPQLVNVVLGEMSLVGPRPITREELLRYGRDRRYYLVVRPGITGLWQVSGRSDVSYERRVQYDRAYIENWSVAGDVAILVRTIPAVLLSDGAV
jgi:exopolysaccharide production protein ExoY